MDDLVFFFSFKLSPFLLSFLCNAASYFEKREVV